MTMDTIIALGTVALVLATIIVGIWSLKSVSRQLWLQTFSEYTRRYSEIMNELPSEARRPGGEFSLAELSPGDRGRTLNTMRRYLNLCSEELYLYKRGRVDGETWDVWKAGIRDTIRLPWFQTAWDFLRIEYEYYQDFVSFMDDLLGKAS